MSPPAGQARHRDIPPEPLWVAAGLVLLPPSALHGSELGSTQTSGAGMKPALGHDTSMKNAVPSGRHPQVCAGEPGQDTSAANPRRDQGSTDQHYLCPTIVTTW